MKSKVLYVLSFVWFVVGLGLLMTNNVRVDVPMKVVQKYQGNSRYGLEFIIVGAYKGHLHSEYVSAAEYTVAKEGDTRTYSLMKRTVDPEYKRWEDQKGWVFFSGFMSVMACLLFTLFQSVSQLLR